MKYFLDTNVIIDGIHGKNANIKTHFESVMSSDIYVSSIVIAELEFGAKHSKDYILNKILYEQFIKDFTEVPFIKAYSGVYGELRHDLTARGIVIGSNDMLIAATALANGGILVTHNTREFSRIKGIMLEDWTDSLGTFSVSDAK